MSIGGPRHPQLVALGARIRSLREATGLSQEAFAAAVGLDRTYYGGIERGERNVAGLNLIRIALVLKVEVGELFPPTGDFSAGASADGAGWPAVSCRRSPVGRNKRSAWRG
jgi:transcriptional regulator with XRE-family HTH domain